MSLKRIMSVSLASVFAVSVPLGYVSSPVSAASGSVVINYDNFPDYYFRKYVAEEIDDGDGVLSKDELEYNTFFECQERGISSLKGIELFKNLDFLNCEGNYLTELDVSKNTKLSTLGCSNNNISSLNLKKNKKLTYLFCNGNPLTEVDISNCPMLIMAYRTGEKYKEGTSIGYFVGDDMWGIAEYKIESGVKTITDKGTNKGWVKVDGDFDTFRFYYSSGKLVTGWKKIDKKWYYFNKKSRAAETGRTKIGKKYYLFSGSGVLKSKGWQKLGGKYYYVKKDGSVTTGWKKISKKWYWFSKYGTMASNCKKKIGKKYYRFAKSGACLNP